VSETDLGKLFREFGPAAHRVTEELLEFNRTIDALSPLEEKSRAIGTVNRNIDSVVELLAGLERVARAKGTELRAPCLENFGNGIAGYADVPRQFKAHLKTKDVASAHSILN
jgi:hypothetical protein